MIIKDNTVVITGADLSPGHEYEIMVQAVSSDGRIQSVEDSPKAVIVLKGRQTVPSQPSGLTATGGIVKIALNWDVQTDTDFDIMEIWRSSTDNFGVAAKVAEVKTTSWTDEIGSTGQTRYYWLIARNTSGKISTRYPSTSGIGATTTGISPTNIDDFAIDATKMFSNTIILTADVWSNNTPVASQITWNTHYLVYGGAYYRVTGSSTALRYVYWDVGHTAGTGTVADPYITTYSKSATYTTAADRFVVVVNESGVVQKVWNAAANMVIGSAFILDAAITNAKIGLLAVTEGNIANLAVTQGKIALLAVGEAQIANLAVTQGKIGLLSVGTAQIDNLAVTDAKISTLAVSKLTAGSITGKTITLLPDMGGIGWDCYINSGKTDFNNVQSGFILGCDYSDSGKAKFYIGDSSNFLNWTGTALAITGALTACPISTKSGAGARVSIFPDANTGLQIVDDTNTDVFLALIGGADVGDIVMGDYAGNKGLKWDKSAATFTVRGALNADDVTAGTLTGRIVQTAAAGKRVVLAVADNTLRFDTIAAANVIVLDDDIDATASRPGMKITDATNGGVLWIYKSATEQTVATERAYYAISSDNTPRFYGEQNNNTTPWGIFYAKFAAGKTGRYFAGVLDSTLKFSVDQTGFVDTAEGYKKSGTQVVGAQGAAVADATDATSVILRLNELLARCRAHGLVAT